MKGFAAAVMAALVCVGLVAVVAAASSITVPSSKQSSFSADPGWEGVNNRKPACINREFKFGWLPPGKLWPTGAVGGTFERATDYRAYYAQGLPSPKTLDD